MSQWLEKEKYGDGSDGDYAPETGTDAPIDSSCSGTAEATELSATNASFEADQIILIHQSRGTGAGQWELNVIDSYTAGTITTKYALAYTYTDSGASQAQVLVVKQYSSALIDTGVTLTSKAWDGNVGGIVAFMCKGTTTVTGNITAKDKGYNGGSAIKNADGKQGEGTSGVGGGTSTSANGSGGGGGSQSGGKGGGGGGHSGSGTRGSDNGGSGGGTSGSTDLITATFGGAGGSGGTESASGWSGKGGEGGGFVVIFSNIFTITGGISSNGDNGSGSEDPSASGGGGGAGAGGSVLIKSNIATLGSNLITATAATGGAKSGDGTNGGISSTGRVAVHYGTSYTGNSNPEADFTLDENLIPSVSGAAFLTQFIGK